MQDFMLRILAADGPDVKNQVHQKLRAQFHESAKSCPTTKAAGLIIVGENTIPFVIKAPTSAAKNIILQILSYPPGTVVKVSAIVSTSDESAGSMERCAQTVLLVGPESAVVRNDTYVVTALPRGFASKLNPVDEDKAVTPTGEAASKYFRANFEILIMPDSVVLSSGSGSQGKPPPAKAQGRVLTRDSFVEVEVLLFDSENRTSLSLRCVEEAAKSTGQQAIVHLIGGRLEGNNTRSHILIAKINFGFFVTAHEYKNTKSLRITVLTGAYIIQPYKAIPVDRLERLTEGLEVQRTVEKAMNQAGEFKGELSVKDHLPPTEK